MKIKDLVPFCWDKEHDVHGTDERNPFYFLQRDMNRLFEDFGKGFFADWPMVPKSGKAYSAVMPRIDVSDTEKEVTVTAELPGMDEKDIDLQFSKNHLILKGEKKEEKEEKNKNFYRMERSYGSFQRVVPMPAEVDSEKISANFKKGVLTVVLPKKELPPKDQKKIEIKTEP